jgi:hypothetical protein
MGSSVSETIFFCSECSQRNCVAADANRVGAMCAKCGSLLFPSETSASAGPKSAARSSTSQPSWERPVNAAEATRTPPQRSSARKRERSAAVRRLFLIPIIAGGLWLYFEVNIAPSSSSAQTAAPFAQARLPQAMARPLPGILSNQTGRVPQAPLEIISSAGQDYFVKLVDAATGQDAVTAYVYGGQRIEIEIPLGKYRMRYASGSTWRGAAHLFGPGDLTRYSEADELFDFKISGSFVNGYTVELILQVGGNLEMRDINASQF